ncbi:protein FAF-like, chloroplastic [Phragmites australis]|uniref:protein FAF-like, chloroplastic n=1 Tax=Phragmites australis TaxID=29695 RepID=UPI002D783AA0|nr:protein FAF-like, chloroplastic [Phragmites australis]
MSVAVCRGPAVPAFEAPSWLHPVEPYKPEVVVDHRPAQVDIWNAIQADVDKATAGAKKASKPYVHPLVRRSSSLMNQKSLEICTESLGNETGSGDFTASLDVADIASLFDSPMPAAAAEAEESFWQHGAARDYAEEQWEMKELVAVNYHCSAGTRSPRRSFPPPLPSMSRRDGPCLQMRPRRQDGRLIIEAVVVRPRGYLHAKRQGGRLRLSFVECSAREQSAASKITTAAAEVSYFPAVEPKNEQEEEAAMEIEEEDEVEEEEEVEVVDRGSVVEVKVSTQPQTPAAVKVHRSTLVINKFVGSTPFTIDQPRGHADTNTAYSEAACDETAQAPPPPTLRRVPSSTTTLAAAVAVASTGTDVLRAPEDDDECGGLHLSASAAAERKQLLLFTSRRGDKQDLLQSVRRCRQLRQKPLFILEPYCIATT